jgi:predicted ATPase
VLAPTPDGGLYFDDEEIGWPVPDSAEAWLAKSIGRGHSESKLHEILADGGQDGPTRDAVATLIDLLRGCRVYHFHDTSAAAPVKQHVSDADNLVLRPDAGNLAAVLYRLRTGDPGERVAYRRIVGSIRQVAPFFRDFVLQPELGDQIRLRWRERGTDAVFSAHQMSDGTLRLVCLTALLLQPALPALVVLDEPELGLHPYAIVQLADMLRQASTRSQIVVATQSVTLMNQFELADLIVVERGATGSAFVRPDANHLRGWLQEYSLGELWEKNLIGGRPGPAAGSAGG